jgi:hypothetical protein
VRLCKLCGKNKATVPDRNTGRLVNRVCSECHAARLRGDLVQILERRAKESSESAPTATKD